MSGEFAQERQASYGLLHSESQRVFALCMRKGGGMIGTLVARKALADAFDALNRHDLAKFMSAWREDGVFAYPGDIPESGTFEGRSAVEGWFRRFFQQFPTIAFDVRDICVRDLFDVVGTNVVAVHWDLKLVNRDTREGRNSGVTVVTLTRGKVTHVKDYIFDLGDNFRRNWGAVANVATEHDAQHA